MNATNSVYIHLPFCASKCIYCDFAVHVGGNDLERREYLGALKQEITLRLTGQTMPPIKTIFFGGGTPSRFKANELTEILDCLQTFAAIAPDAEITMEMNPEGIADDLVAYRKAGINRVSVGIQSLQANELKRLSRIHGAQQAISTVQQLQAAGFSNIAVDVMLGTPEQTPTALEGTLAQLVQLPITHISAYGLQVEDSTPLEQLINQKRFTLPDEETHIACYQLAQQYLAQHGFEQYEISNFAKPGCQSQHNLNYWHNGAFWGFGMGATGYVEGLRYQNHEQLNDYLQNPTGADEVVAVTTQECLENTLIFGMRLLAGVPWGTLKARGLTPEQQHGLQQKVAQLQQQGFLLNNPKALQLSPQALLVSNSVIQQLLFS